MNADARWLDGNALGGFLQELFGAEVTAMPHTCAECGASNPVAAYRLFIGAGAVLRCPVCDHIALVAAKLRDRHAVRLTGAWQLEVPHDPKEKSP